MKKTKKKQFPKTFTPTPQALAPESHSKYMCAACRLCFGKEGMRACSRQHFFYARGADEAYSVRI